MVRSHDVKECRMEHMGHGNAALVEHVLPPDEAASRVGNLKRLSIGGRAARECIDIAYGFFTPLAGFQGSEDVDSICGSMSLADGTLWPIPILLDVDNSVLKELGVKEGEDILLTYRDAPLAILTVDEIFTFDTSKLSEAVLGTGDDKHPGVRMMRGLSNRFLAGGIQLVREPVFQPPFDAFWYTPKKLRALFNSRGWRRIVAHQTRNVPHGGHEWLMKGAWFSAHGDLPVEELHTGVLVSCIIGPKRVGDYIDEAILLCHDQLRRAGYFREDIHQVSFVLWDMRYAGPREALFHAILRTNLGCTHHMFGRDHAGVGSSYDPYDAHRIFDRFDDEELNIKPVRVLEWWYCPVCGEVTYSGLCGHEQQKQSFSGTLIRSMLTDRVKPTKLIFRPEIYDLVMECADRYGFGSPFCTEQYLARRGPVFTLPENHKP
jgi:sulfate adenylyltransferase